jgi:hypothetical protein
LRHILVAVIDDHRQLIRKRPVGALDDEVARRPRNVLLDVSGDCIVEGNDRIRRPKTDRACDSTGRQTIATRPGVNRLAAERRGSGAVDIGAAASAFVNESSLAQSRERCIVQKRASRLRLDLAIPSQAVATQRLEDLIRRPGGDPRCVEIFDAHEPPPAPRPCEQPRSDCGDQAAEVQRACRRRCEAAGQRGSEP